MALPFIPDRCAHIDTVDGNVLIRGNLPLTGDDWHFAYKEIIAASGVDLTKFMLIDMPILDNIGERSSWASELSAFGAEPKQFPPSYWPPYTQKGYDPKALLGTGMLSTEGGLFLGHTDWAPFEGLPAGQDPTLYLDWPGWNFSGFVDNVIDMLKSMPKAAIYVHCMLGADRTGAFHIGYLMRSKGLSLKEASDIANKSTSAGPPNADYERLVAAYAKSLKRA
jgi:hypothetical protein